MTRSPPAAATVTATTAARVDPAAPSTSGEDGEDREGGDGEANVPVPANPAKATVGSFFRRNDVGARWSGTDWFLDLIAQVGAVRCRVPPVPPAPAMAGSTGSTSGTGSTSSTESASSSSPSSSPSSSLPGEVKPLLEALDDIDKYTSSTPSSSSSAARRKQKGQRRHARGTGPRVREDTLRGVFVAHLATVWYDFDRFVAVNGGGDGGDGDPFREWRDLERFLARATHELIQAAIRFVSQYTANAAIAVADGIAHVAGRGGSADADALQMSLEEAVDRALQLCRA